MRVGDVADELLVGYDNATAFAALAALGAVYERTASEFYGGGPPCARHLSGEAIAGVRAALVAALDAFDAARVRCPSGPIGIVAADGGVS